MFGFPAHVWLWEIHSNAQDYRLHHTHMINPSFVPFIIFVWLSQANLADFGDNQWVTCFQETAEALLGHSAETLGQLRETVRHTHNLAVLYLWGL